jgi:hypothetical protein
MVGHRVFKHSVFKNRVLKQGVRVPFTLASV